MLIHLDLISLTDFVIFNYFLCFSLLSEYIQVNLGTPKRIFGFEFGGDPKVEKLVTSLLVLYSLDNTRYSYVTDAGGVPINEPLIKLLTWGKKLKFGPTLTFLPIFWTDFYLKTTEI